MKSLNLNTTLGPTWKWLFHGVLLENGVFLFTTMGDFIRSWCLHGGLTSIWRDMWQFLVMMIYVSDGKKPPRTMLLNIFQYIFHMISHRNHRISYLCSHFSASRGTARFSQAVASVVSERNAGVKNHGSLCWLNRTLYSLDWMIGGFYMVVIYIYNWITLLIGLEDFSQGFSSKNHFIIYFMNKSWLDRQECFYVSAMFEHHGDKRQNHEKNMRADNQQGNVLGFNRQTYGASGCLRSGFSVGEFGSGVPKLMDKLISNVIQSWMTMS